MPEYYNYNVENLSVDGGYYFPCPPMVITTLDEHNTLTVAINVRCSPNYTHAARPAPFSFYCPVGSQTYANLTATAKCVINCIGRQTDALYRAGEFVGDDSLYGAPLIEADMMLLCECLPKERADKTVHDIRHFTLRVDKILCRAGTAAQKEMPPDGKLIFTHREESAAQKAMKRAAKSVTGILGNLNSKDVSPINAIVYTANKINPNIAFTKAACELIANSSVKNKRKLIADCIKHCQSQGKHIADERIVLELIS